MKPVFNYLKIAFFSMVIFISCTSKKSDVPVPKETAFVVHINGASLSEKLPWDEVKNSSWFEEALQQPDNEFLRSVLKNPEESGVDLKKEMYFYIMAQGKPGLFYNGFYSNLSDSSKFLKLLQTLLPQTTPEKKENLLYVANDNLAVAWNKNKAVVVSIMNEKQVIGVNDSTKKLITKDSLLAFAGKMFSLKKGQSLGSDSRFSDLLKEKGDIHFWYNTSFMTGMLPAMLSLTKIGELISENALAAAVSFDNGKIHLEGKQYYGKTMSELYKKYPPENFDANTLKKLPAANPLMVFSFNYPPEGLKEFIKTLGLDGLLNMFLAESQLSMDDFFNAHKGDLLFSVLDVKRPGASDAVLNQPKENLNTDKEPKPVFLFAGAIKDKTAFDKFTDGLNKLLKKEEGAPSPDFQKVKFVVKDGWFIAGNDPEQMNQFGNASADHPFISKIKGYPMGMFVDFQKFFEKIRPDIAKNEEMMKLDEAQKTWKEIVFTGGTWKKNGVTFQGDIVLTDASVNSLKKLNQFLSQLYEISKKDETGEDIQEPAKNDTLTVPEPDKTP
ncbi:MAG: DUF4836 family protein [Chitinophagaceae bacterium]|nr:DUF4836 family protein [Chitinophagaceae bacterium]